VLFIVPTQPLAWQVLTYIIRVFSSFSVSHIIIYIYIISGRCTFCEVFVADEQRLYRH
jgi:hypothetical protein